MSDNEFDDLFKEQLIAAEIEPSRDLWNDISGKIKPKKQPKFVVWRWSGAVAAAVLLFFFLKPNTEKVRLVKPEENVVMAESPSEIAVKVEGDIVEPVHINKSKESFAKAKLVKAENKINAPQASKDEKQNILIALQPKANNIHLNDKAEEPKKIELKEENQMIAAVFEEVKAIDVLDEKVSIVENANHQTGIRNVGDLVNLVIDKVDKREQKLIRFNTDEDDNSKIVSLNLGFIKFNKRK